jgi:DNA-binding NarL/FixJ family response regulator
VRISIVVDVCLYREGLAAILGRHEQITVVASAASVDEFLAGAAQGPQIVLLDLTSADGLAAIELIASKLPQVKVVGLAVQPVEKEIIGWAEAGAAGFVARDATLDDLVAAVLAAAKGEIRISGDLFRHVAALAASAQPQPDGARLTRREWEIVGLIEDGFSNKEIARRLCIQVSTVKNHVHNILNKLDARRRAQVVARVRAPELARRMV